MAVLKSASLRPGQVPKLPRRQLAQSIAPRYVCKRLVCHSGFSPCTEGRSSIQPKLSVSLLARSRGSAAARRRDVRANVMAEASEVVGQPSDGEGVASFTQALFNSVNILMGVGLLSIPYALKEGGWASLLVLGLLWAATNYTGKVLIKCQEVQCNQGCRAKWESDSMDEPQSTLLSFQHIQPALSRNSSSSSIPTNMTVLGSRAPAAGEPSSTAVTVTVAHGIPPSTSAVQVATLDTVGSGSAVSGSSSAMNGISSSSSKGPSCLLQTYEDIGQAAFGNAGRSFITTVLYTELIGTCALFFILEGDHMQLLLHSLLGSRAVLPSHEQLMGLSAGLFLPTTWLPDLSALAGLGALGMSSAFGLTGVVLYNFFEGGIHLAKTVPVHMHSLPITFGLSAFVFAGHAVFPSIYRSMKDRSEYPKMLDYTYAIVGLTCAAIGIAGYAMYGNRTLDEITMNLQKGPLQMAATAFILVSPWTKFALTLEPVAQGVDKFVNQVKAKGSLTTVLQPKRSSRLSKTVTRTGLGAFALLLATSVPQFAFVMAVIGSFLTLTVSVIFPSLCYLKLFGDELSERERILNYFIVALGVMCAISGTYTSVQDLVQTM